MQDVAREADVSPSTVSRALHTRGYASPAVWERVRQAADRIGYVTDHNARNLRTRTSTSIGVLISDLRNPFYAVEMGRSCARLLLARIRGELPAKRRIVKVPARLIVRGSTGPARR